MGAPSNIMATNCFFLFCLEKRPELKEQLPGLNNSEITSELGKAWRDLPTAEKQKYKAIAKQNSQKFKAENPTYTRKPKREAKYQTSFRIEAPQTPIKKSTTKIVSSKLSSFKICPQVTLPSFHDFVKNVNTKQTQQNRSSVSVHSTQVQSSHSPAQNSLYSPLKLHVSLFDWNE